jgi:hypothetical protein
MASLVLKLTSDGANDIRGDIFPDGMQVYSAFDFLTKALAKKDKGAYARKWFGDNVRDESSEFYNEFVGQTYSVQFPGKFVPKTCCKILVVRGCEKSHNLYFSGAGQRDTPCMTIRGLQRLLMILGGKVAAEFRVLVEGVFTRVMAGDQSLIEVINANAASDAPVQQVYRQALAQEPVIDQMSLSRKRRLEELEIERLEVELESKKVEIESKKLANVAMAREHLIEITGQYRELCQDTVMDERARLMLKDSMLNMAMNQGQRLLTNGVPNKPISLSSVALELGLKIPENNFITIGKEVSKRYFQLHGKKPPKHDQLIKGKVTLVNSYMESDRPIVEEVLRTVK